MLALCSELPLHTCRKASSVAPTTWADASCIPRKTGLSSVPSPKRSSPGPGWRAMRFTASMNAGSCTVASWSSVATGAAIVRSWSGPLPTTPSPAARRMVRSTRSGVIGWSAPKS